MLKIGIIGSGSMGKNHARVCAELEDVELVGVADVDKETAKKVAEKFGTKAFFDYRNLLSEIDAAIVATPTVSHYKIAMDLLNNGRHVLVEKPICDSIEKAEEVDYIKQSVTLSSSSFKQINDMDLYNVPIQYNLHEVALEKKEPLKNEIEDFIDAIERNKKPLATGEDGVMALKIAEAAIASYKSGGVVTL